MSLQDAFYVIAIVYMGVMFVIMIAMVVAIFVIKAKINAIHRNIEEKLHAAMNVAHIGEAVAEKISKVWHK